MHPLDPVAVYVIASERTYGKFFHTAVYLADFRRPTVDTDKIIRLFVRDSYVLICRLPWANL